MKKYAWFICLASIFCCRAVLVESLEDFGNKMSNFYLAPTQEAFNTFQQSADHFSGELTKRSNGADILVSVMIARIFEKYNWPISDGIFGAKATEILAGKSTLAKYIADDSQVDPMKLDVWWASFFATGDERYLENIFKYAGLELPKNDVKRMLVIGAATWSFKANCHQHKRVLEFAMSKLNFKTTSEIQAKFLHECIAFTDAKSTEQ